MTSSVVKNKPQPVVTVTFESQSLCLPLQFILKLLCQITGCCSCDDRMQQIGAAAFGAIQILVGFVIIGLGTERTSPSDGHLTGLKATYWLGVVFTVCGIMTLLPARCCSRYTTGLILSVNIIGSVFSIAGVVLYSINLGDASVVWMCSRTENAIDVFADHCTPTASTVQILATNMDFAMVVLSVFHLCVCVSLTVLATKALSSKTTEVGRDTDIYQGVLKEYTYDQTV